MEEAPAELIKIVKEVVHLSRWNHLGKESEVPIRSKYLNIHTNLLQVLVQLWQMRFHELRDQCAVLYMPRKALHVNLTHLKVFNQGHKKPKSYLFAAMQQKSANNEVHPLNVANAGIILRKGLQHSLEALLPLARRLLENLLLRKRSGNIALNLPLLRHANEVFDA